MKKLLKNNTVLLVSSLVFGVIFGFIMKLLPNNLYIDEIIINGLMRLLGTGFINLIKMTVIPLVFVSLICGISSFGDTKKLGAIGVKTVMWFMVSTIVAIVIGVVCAQIFKPGAGLNCEYEIVNTVNSQESKNIVDMILDIIPSNPVKSMSKGNLLQILVFAVFFGISLGTMGEKSKKILDVFETMNESIMKIVMFVMKLAPIGVFALISITVYSTGTESLLGILKLIGVFALALIMHVIIVYCGMLKFIAKIPVTKFFRRYAKVAGVAFSTASSNAVLPMSMQMMKEAGVDSSLYQFVLPVGTTVNMAGTAVLQGLTTVFIAQAYNINLSFQAIITVVVSAVLASIGTAGIPGVGMVMMAMVLESVGLPVQGIGLVLGVDRILDMMRTTVNVLGDSVTCMALARTENMINLEKFENI
ncbi:MAG: dicarboxylate/amino acid:cation symporter [Clostridia bacterium]|nr:dicarboxylate/amino acid:cation symporter [Clostridia bacterium]